MRAMVFISLLLWGYGTTSWATSSSCHGNFEPLTVTADRFYRDDASRTDPVFGFAYKVRGERLKAPYETIKHGSSPIPVFHRLARGGNADAYLGVFNGRVIVVKKYRLGILPNSHEMREFLTETEAPKILASKGVSISLPLEHSAATGTILKEYEPGPTLDELQTDRQYVIRRFSKSLSDNRIYEQAFAEFQALLDQIQDITLSSEYGRMARVIGMRTHIDEWLNKGTNTVFFGGKCKLLEP